MLIVIPGIILKVFLGLSSSIFLAQLFLKQFNFIKDNVKFIKSFKHLHGQKNQIILINYSKFNNMKYWSLEAGIIYMEICNLMGNEISIKKKRIFEPYLFKS